jgi:hypothetical protein
MISVISKFANGSSKTVHYDIRCLQDACERAVFLANAFDESRAVAAAR